MRRVAARVILHYLPIDGIAEVLVHPYRYFVADADEEIHEVAFLVLWGRGGSDYKQEKVDTDGRNQNNVTLRNKSQSLIRMHIIIA